MEAAMAMVMALTMIPMLKRRRQVNAGHVLGGDDEAGDVKMASLLYSTRKSRSDGIEESDKQEGS